MNEHQDHHHHHLMSTMTTTTDHPNLSPGFSNIFNNHQRLDGGDLSDSNFLYQHHGGNMLDYYHPCCQSFSYSSQHYNALDTSEDFSFSWANDLPTKDEEICSTLQQVDDTTSQTKTAQVKRQRLATKRNETNKKRNLANIQERKRMHRLNDALEQLRKIVPPEYRQKRMSKMQILHSAITYIKSLQDILQSN